MEGPSNQRKSCLAGNDKEVHIIKIAARELGVVNLTLSAFVDGSYPGTCDPVDGVEKRSGYGFFFFNHLLVALKYLLEYN